MAWHSLAHRRSNLTVKGECLAGERTTLIWRGEHRRQEAKSSMNFARRDSVFNRDKAH